MRPIFQAMLVVFAVAGVQAQAQELDGNEFIDFCDGATGDYMEGFCQGLALGTFETWAQVDSVLTNVIYFCVPVAGVRPEQVLDIALKYQKENPEIRSDPFVGSSLFAFIKAFPCS